MTATRRQLGGFSLLEMLVALSLLGLVLGTLYQAATGATRNVALAERYSYAVLLAESLLADASGLGGAPRELTGSSGGYQWRVRRAAVPGGGRGSLTLQRVTATVSWEGGGNSEIALTTIIPALDPKGEQ